MPCFQDIYRNKKVLITGNTGFKGSWLSIWLHSLGAEVYGISDEIPTTPSHYEEANLQEYVKWFQADIIDYKSIEDIIRKVSPDYVFHLAAQAIVKESYESPLRTIQCNVIGTSNLLEALRVINMACIVVMITSDKAYDNVEWVWGYRETDELGGSDPYSASKGAAELLIKTYTESFFKNKESNIIIGTGRAGNVIGGGDWAKHRLIPDAVKAWSKNEPLEIRAPHSTRPWQHVLEPLSGYLRLGERLAIKREALSGEAFNFGPDSANNYSVEKLLAEMSAYWSDVQWYTKEDKTPSKEAGLLKLNCDKALHYLDWKPTLDFQTTVRYVSEWYKEYYKEGRKDMYQFSLQQIETYIKTAVQRRICWTM